MAWMLLIPLKMLLAWGSEPDWGLAAAGWSASAGTNNPQGTSSTWSPPPSASTSTWPQLLPNVLLLCSLPPAWLQDPTLSRPKGFYFNEFKWSWLLIAWWIFPPIFLALPFWEIAIWSVYYRAKKVSGVVKILKVCSIYRRGGQGQIVLARCSLI